MKNVWLGILLLGTVPCLAQNTTANALDPEEFEKGINRSHIQVFDVRTAAEFKTGHIKYALQADWNDQPQFKERVKYVDKHKPVYIYCLVGGRSAAAAAWMRNNGFKTVIELRGGINAWKNAGKPVEGSSNEPQMTMAQYEAAIPVDKTVLVDFGADWCPPCVQMAPVLKEILDKKNLDFLFLKIDAGIHTDLMKQLHIEPIPCFIIYKNGKETWRKSGIVSKDELKDQLK
jgi:rhodanese-related sulfurtransferase